MERIKNKKIFFKDAILSALDMSNEENTCISGSALLKMGFGFVFISSKIIGWKERWDIKAIEGSCKRKQKKK